jgi:hypothetical protein
MSTTSDGLADRDTRSDSSGAASSVARAPAGRSEKEREKEWPPVRVHTRVKENAVKGNMSKNGVKESGELAAALETKGREVRETATTASRNSETTVVGSSHENSTATKRGDSAAVGSKRARDPEVEDVPAKRTRRGNAQGLEPSTPARITRSRSAQVEGARGRTSLAFKVLVIIYYLTLFLRSYGRLEAAPYALA